MRLSHSAFDRVLEILPELYACRPVPGFLATTVRLLSTVIACDGCAWLVYEFSTSPTLITIVEDQHCITPYLASRLAATAPSHPFVDLWHSVDTSTALLFTDVPGKIRLRYLDENRDVYRVIGASHMSISIDFDATHAVAVSFRRASAGFTEEERLCANLLRPHLSQGYANAQLLSRLLDESPWSATTDGAGLTPRESQVGFWLTKGKTNPEIAVILGVAPRTIEKHIEAVLRKLQVENRTTAALTLASVGLALLGDRRSDTKP